MLFIFPDNCSSSTVKKLNNLQKDIDNLDSFLEKREKGNLYWKHRRKNQAFREVGKKLLTTCPGGFCCYCETSQITGLDHVYPKKHYPSKAFCWDNYVLACTKCNSHHKGSKWAIFKDKKSLEYWNELDWNESPPQGDPLFIDIRTFA